MLACYKMLVPGETTETLIWSLWVLLGEFQQSGQVLLHFRNPTLGLGRVYPVDRVIPSMYEALGLIPNPS